jgi:hypothetical protein
MTAITARKIRDGKRGLPPAVLVEPPFVVCPACEVERLGRVSVRGTGLTRRCLSCGYWATYRLPRLSKKVIYLDQFAISEMAKAADPALSVRLKPAERDFWMTLFEILDRLVSAHLVVCPVSAAHYDESIASRLPKALEQICLRLSGGVRAHGLDQVRRVQIYDDVRALAQPDYRSRGLCRGRAFSGDGLDGWLDRFVVFQPFQADARAIASWRAWRDEVGEELQDVARSWREHPAKFEAAIEHELVAAAQQYGPSALLTVEEALIDAAVPSDRRAELLGEWASSTRFRDTPSVRIPAVIWAALSSHITRDAKRNLPGRGMVTDINTVGAILPYCDKLLVDRELGGLLSEKRVRQYIDQFGCTIYTARDRTPFWLTSKPSRRTRALPFERSWRTCTGEILQAVPQQRILVRPCVWALGHRAYGECSFPAPASTPRPHADRTAR